MKTLQAVFFAAATKEYTIYAHADRPDMNPDVTSLMSLT